MRRIHPHPSTRSSRILGIKASHGMTAPIDFSLVDITRVDGHIEVGLRE